MFPNLRLSWLPRLWHTSPWSYSLFASVILYTLLLYTLFGSFFHTTSFRDIEDNFVGNREIAAALTVCALYSTLYNMNLEARVLFLLLHTYSTVTQPQKRKKNRQKIIAGISSSSGIIVPIAISKSWTTEKKKSFVFLFNFFIWISAMITWK